MATRPRLQDPELSLLSVPWLVPAWELGVSVRDLSSIFSNFLSGEWYFRFESNFTSILHVTQSLSKKFWWIILQRMSHPSQQTAPGGREVAEVVVSEFLSVSPCVEELGQFMLSLLYTWIYQYSVLLRWCDSVLIGVSIQMNLSRNEFQIFLEVWLLLGSWFRGLAVLSQDLCPFMLWVVSGDLNPGLFSQWPVSTLIMFEAIAHWKRKFHFTIRVHYIMLL